MKKAVLAIAVVVGMTSCVSKKKYNALEQDKNQVDTELSAAKLELAKIKDEQKKCQDQVGYLKSVNNQLLTSVDKLATLSAKEAENLERSLEQLNEKDLQIKSLQDAKNKQDSVNFALVSSLKGSLDDINDEDVQISVDGGVVFINISDKLLFKSGSATVSKDATKVIEKVAKIINDKPDMEVMVEGHTDDRTLLAGKTYQDNWELSCQRAASVVRVLEKKFNVPGERLVAAGRSSYYPIGSNDHAEGRAQNRRTRIVLLPKIDQFYKMIEEELQTAE